MAFVLEGRVAAEVDGLRRALSSGELDRLAAHVTLVPPRNVREDEFDAVLAHLRRSAAGAAPIELRLGPPATFARGSRVVYLAVEDAAGRLAALQGALAAGPLAPPPGRPVRPFVPHVTLARCPPERLAAALRALAGYRADVLVERISLLEQDEDAPLRPWRVIADVAFGAPVVVGRGGRELSFRLSGRLDERALAWAAEERGAPGEGGCGPGAEPFAITAWQNERLVGLATGAVHRDVVELDDLVVARVERGLGVGGQLLGEVERLALARGCARVRLLVAASGRGAEACARRGYEATARLPAWRDGEDFAVMERRLRA